MSGATTKIIIMFYKDGDAVRHPALKKVMRMEITENNNDVRRLKERVILSSLFNIIIIIIIIVIYLFIVSASFVDIFRFFHYGPSRPPYNTLI